MSDRKGRPVKLAIVGSRDFTDWFRFRRALEPYLRMSYSQRSGDYVWWIEEVVSGGARGADTLAKQWADVNNIKLKVFPADWETYGKSAGFRRNVDIADYADACIAFWDMHSRGTASTIDLFRERNKPVVIIPIGDLPLCKSA